MNLNLFEIEEKIKPFQWAELAVSLTYKERDIIRWIMLLHNDGKPFDVDPTYSTGRFWDGIPDLFVLGRTNVLWSPNMANQQHARKNHCYFIVFQAV